MDGRWEYLVVGGSPSGCAWRDISSKPSTVALAATVADTRPSTVSSCPKFAERLQLVRAYIYRRVGVDGEPNETELCATKQNSLD